MSKAFTKESDGDDDDDLPEESGGLPLTAKNYMTPAGFARMREELDTLMRKERPEVVKVVSWAAGNGDRSENGDYIYGKKRLREIDRRVRYLSKRLANAEVVDPAKRGQDRPGVLRRHRDLRQRPRARSAPSRSSASTRSSSPRAMSAGSRRSPRRCSRPRKATS